MRLTKKKAIEISIELWAWLAETGKVYKSAWPGWEKYGEMGNDCALCEQDARESQEDCGKCPYYAKFGYCPDPENPFGKWSDSQSVSKRKQYASQFLEQLKTLQRKGENNGRNNQKVQGKCQHIDKGGNNI